MSNPLIQLLSTNECDPTWSVKDWDILIKQARKARLLAQVAAIVFANKIKLPAPLNNHLESADILAKSHTRAIRWELTRIEDALHSLDIPVVLLKGAAYLSLNAPHAFHRFYGDIDLLVEERYLTQVEEALKWSGWTSIKTSSYDQTYYRKWMHEIPPLQHARRGSTIDLHHRILPRSGRITVDGNPLISNKQTSRWSSFFYCLSNQDLILHSCAHLMSDGESDAALRDLYDMHCLIKTFAKDDTQFLTKLIERSIELGLGHWLYYCFFWLQQYFKTIEMETIEHLASKLKLSILNKLMLRIQKHAFIPHHNSCQSPFFSISQKLLYLRGHYLRMPWRLLIPHLIRKSFISDKNNSQ